MYKRIVEDNSPGTETSNALLYSTYVKHKCTISTVVLSEEAIRGITI